jgi:predicted ferric reductase
MSTQVLWYTTRGAGAVSLLLLSAVLILGVLGVKRFEAAGWPRFLTVGLHRNLSLLALVFLALHIVTAIVDPFTSLGLAALVPFGSSYRTLWLGLGAVAFELMLAIAATSLVRDRIGHRAWRLVHWLAYAMWPIAVAHGWGTGTDAATAWMLAIDGLCITGVGLAIGMRVLMPAPDALAGERSRFRAAVRREVRP